MRMIFDAEYGLSQIFIRAMRDMLILGISWYRL